MSSSEIAKAIAQKSQLSTAASKKKDTLEQQVEAAEFYGQIKPDNPPPEKRGRGRPPNKSKSPGKTPNSSPERNGPVPLKKPTDERVNKIVEEMMRSRLIQKLRAYAAYWPDICGPTLNQTNIYECSNEQLERICKGFEDTVNCQAEIVDLPRTFKHALGKVEPLAVGIGMTNKDHPVLSHLSRLGGFGNALNRDPAVDRNVKLLAIRFMGRMPKNPILNLLWSVTMVGLEVYKTNYTAESLQYPEEEEQVYTGL